MILPNQMKNYLIHDDSLIRRFAASYLADITTKDKDVMPLLLKAYRMEKDVSLRGYIAMYMKDFPQTSETMENLDRLSRNVAKDRHHFESAICYADINLIMSYPKKIKLTDKYLSSLLNYRIELTNKDTNELWNDFKKMCSVAKNSYENFDFTKVKFLCKELCGREDVPMEKIHDWFNKFSWKDPHFDEVFMCLLAGELKLKEYAELLLKCLSYDWDYINEESMYALCKIDSLNIINKIGEVFNKENEIFQIYASGVLERYKTPESEEVITSLFKKTDKIFIKSILIFALCNLVSEKAIELGVPLLPDNYDDSLDSLERNLYIVSIINGLNPPQLDEWKNIAYEEDNSFKKMSLDYDFNNIF